MLGFRKFRTRLNTLIIKETLMDYLCSACLDREVILCKRYLWFTRVAILRHKIAGIACQHYVIYLTLPTFAYLYHFADVSKMISNRFTGVSG